MHTNSSHAKEVRIPGPDHPITISPAEGRVRVMVAGKVVAESARALQLEKKGYPPVYCLPRNDALRRMSSVRFANITLANTPLLKASISLALLACYLILDPTIGFLHTIAQSN